MPGTHDLPSNEELSYNREIPSSSTFCQKEIFPEGAMLHDSNLYTNVNSSKKTTPYLQIIVQPESKFRYRYESDGPSHGVIRGDVCQNKKSFPTVKLENFKAEKPVVVKISLCTSDPIPKPHLFKLVGKEGVCYEELRENNMAICSSIRIQAKKRDVIISELTGKKIKEYTSKGLECNRKGIEKSVKDYMKSVKLKDSKLGFQAFYQDDLTRPLCETVFSHVISNTKEKNSGELGIIRMSSCTGKCTGGEEVFIFCDKIEKEDIEIHFYEDNDDFIGQGTFSPADVHHQVAIAFKIPQYKRNIENSVKICLYRPSDGKKGPCRDFTYIIDETDLSRKKRKADLQNNPIQASNYAGDVESCQNKATFPDKNSDSTLMDLDFSDILMDSEIAALLHMPLNSDASNSPVTGLESFGINEMSLPTDDDLFSTDKKEIAQCMHSSCFINENTSNSGHTESDLVEGIQKPMLESIKEPCSRTLNIDAVVKQVSSLSMSKTNKMSCFDENFDRNHKLEVLKANICELLKENVDSTQLHDVPNLICIRDKNGNNLLHLAVLKQDEVFIWNMLEFVTESIINQQNNAKDTPLQLAVQQNCCKITYLLVLSGGDINVVDQRGKNVFHLAAENNFYQCMKVLLISLQQKKQRNLCSYINALNHDGLSPLHLSIINGSKECMKLLLQAKADVNLSEKKCGRSSLHLAIEFQPSWICELLIQPNLDLDAVDFRGYTPLEYTCVLRGISFDKLSVDVNDAKSIVQFLVNLNSGNTVQQWKLREDKLDYSDDPGRDSDEQYFNDIHFDESGMDTYFDHKEEPASPNSYLYVEKKLCDLLDKSNWRKLGVVVGLTKNEMDGIAELDEGLSPSKTVLKHIKEVFKEENFVTVLTNLLQSAGLTEAVQLLNGNG